MADWGAIGQLLGGGAAVGSVINSGMTAWAAKDAAAQNLQFQKTTREYNRGVQKTIFSREDSAVQRRVADLKAAGLSPVLAAGQGARAGQAMQEVAPRRGFEDIVARNRVSQTTMDAIATMAQVRKTEAETNLINQTTPQKVELNAEAIAKAVNENKILKSTMAHVIDRVKSESRTAQYKRYVAFVEKEAAGLDSVYLRAAKLVVRESAATEKTNPYLMRITEQAVAIELAQSKSKLLRSEAKIFGEGGSLEGVGPIVKILTQLIRGFK